MIKIIKPRASGKTTELIKISAETGAYIMTVDRDAAHDLFNLATDLGYKIPYPGTFDDLIHQRYRGSFVKHCLIDNADVLLARICPGMTIDAITMTESEGK